MVLQNHLPRIVQGRADRCQLHQNLGAVIPLLHHPLHLFQVADGTGQAVDHRLLIGVNMAVAVGNAVSMEISVVMKRLFPGRSGVIMCHRAFLFPESLLFFIIIAATPGQCKGGRGIFFPQCGIL